MKKILVLIFAFLLPLIGVVIFKFYTINHFSVRVYYQEQVPEDLNCDNVKAPYSIDRELAFEVDDSIAKPFLRDQYKIISMPNKDYPLKAELNEVGDTFYDQPYVGVYVLKDSAKADNSRIPVNDNIIQVATSDESINSLKDCVFLFGNDEDNTVLIDNENKIRGYYNLYKREEVDSLIIEAKILLREKELTGNVHDK